MHIEEILVVMFLASTVGALLLGYPVAFTLAGVSVIYALVGNLFDVFNWNLFTAVSARNFGTMTNEVLVAVPLFIFMGVMLEKSRVAENLLVSVGQVFGRLPGGLSISVTLVGMLLAASTGIVGATVVAMGMLSLPTMMRANYDPKLACGTICASGTLGQIIPPSVALVLLGEVLAGSYSEAQLKKGNFTPEPFSVIDLFAGAVIPGLVLVGLFLAYQIFVAVFQSKKCPPFYDSTMSGSARWKQVGTALFPPIFLILAVLGSILSGIATTTEGAAFGAVGSMILAAAKNQLKPSVLGEVVRSSLKMTCMVFGILIGASLFALAFRGLGGDQIVIDFFSSLPGGVFTAMLVIMVVIFLLGFIVDFIEIIFIVVPIVAPALFALDVNPIWLGIMFAVNLQTSFLTPPFGWALFYLRSVAPPELKTKDIYLGIIPFVALQLLGLILLAVFPEMATWLPSLLF